VALAFVLAGCAHQRDVSLVKDRMVKLQPLSRYRGTVCEVHTQPTQPALARYAQMFPKDFEQLPRDAFIFKWRQTENRCEVVAPVAPKSPVVKAQRGFVEAAFCVLGQYFFINSPFDELKSEPKDVVRNGDWVQIRDKKDPELGYFLDRKDFLIVAKTKSRGEFQVHYKEFDSQWLPDRMEHKPENMQIVLDEMEYGERVAGRRTLKSLMLSVGTERPLAHSQITVSNCERL
jgi:hypothetical protein